MSPSKRRSGLVDVLSDDIPECPIAKKVKVDGNGRKVVSPEGMGGLHSPPMCNAGLRQALSCSTSQHLLCREKELDSIRKFVVGHVISQKPASMYISGPPGTGKTACVTKVLQDLKMEGSPSFWPATFNCVSLTPTSICKHLSAEMNLCSIARNTSSLSQLLTQRSSSEFIVLVLDEMDQISTKSGQLLYELFELAATPECRLILIGISNALDFTDRLLPRLNCFKEAKPELLHFVPYNTEQIETILLSRIEGACDLIDPQAIKYCARKVAAASGDLRRALNVLRNALEQVVVSWIVPDSQDVSPGCPLAAASPKVDLPGVDNVIQRVYGSRVLSSVGSQQAQLPMQQKVLLCSLLLLSKQGKARDWGILKVFEAYSSACRKMQLVPAGLGDVHNMCLLLESSALVRVVQRNGGIRASTVSLAVHEKEVGHALQDHALLSLVLNTH